MKKLKDNIKTALRALEPAIRNQTAVHAAGVFAGAFGGGMHVIMGDFSPALLYLAAAGCFYVHILLTTTDWWGSDGN